MVKYSSVWVLIDASLPDYEHKMYPLSLLSFIFILIAERRQAEASRIREKYPDRIPVRLYNQWTYTANFFFLTPEVLLIKF